MKTFIFVIILAAFLQTTTIEVDLVLLLVLSRSLERDDSFNMYMAFFAGILLGLLTATNIGFYALFFLIATRVGYLLRKSPVTNNIFTILPIAFFMATALGLAERIFLGQSINIVRYIIDTLSSLPIYFCVKFWEERFIVAPQMKLKLK